MYQNCCKKCGSTDLYTDQKGNNTGLYCSDCGAWIKWLSKEELRAFDHSKDIEEENIKGLSNTRIYYTPKLNLDKVLQRILFDAIICRIRKIKTSHF